MKNKNVSRLIVTLLIVAQLFALLPVALADDVSGSELIQVDRFSLVFYYAGTSDTIPEDEYDNLPQDAAFEIQYRFTVLDAADESDNIQPGDTYNITLPAALRNIATFEVETSFVLYAYTADGVQILNADDGDKPFEIGTLSISADGIATIVFGDGVKLNDAYAAFIMSGSLDKGKIGDDTKASFSLTANGVVKNYELGFEDDPRACP